MAGGADDWAHLEVHSLPWQTHLRTGPHTGQVARNTFFTCHFLVTCTFSILSHLSAPCFSSLFLSLSLTLTQILRVIDQRCRFSISHLVSHYAIPTRPSWSERLITCSPLRGEQPLSNLKYPLIITVLSWQPGERFNQSLNARNDRERRSTEGRGRGRRRRRESQMTNREDEKIEMQGDIAVFFLLCRHSLFPPLPPVFKVNKLAKPQYLPLREKKRGRWRQRQRQREE